jgi:hypothetical protein
MKEVTQKYQTKKLEELIMKIKEKYTQKKRVFVCSPFSSATKKGLESNIAYMRHCLFDCIEKGEAPFAPHGLYPQVLDDKIPAQRKLGIDCGHAFLCVCDYVVVYKDLGISAGMCLDIEAAKKMGKEIVFRLLSNDT